MEPRHDPTGSAAPSSAAGWHEVVLRRLQFVLLSVYLVALVEAVVADDRTPTESPYVWLILGLIVAVVAALQLGRRGRTRLSIALTITSTVVPPWYAVLADPKVLEGDFVPVAYVVFPVMLAAMLVRARTVAILAVGQLLGMLAVWWLAPPTTFNWPSLITLVAIVMAISVTYDGMIRNNLRRIAEQIADLERVESDLRDLATHDPLTGLWNRRAFGDQLDREVARARRQATTIGLVMLDIDHFKTFNDTLGHPGGDLVLKRVAAVLTASVRLSDLACRLGGDEFVLLLPGASPAETRALAERVRESIGHDQPHGVRPQQVTFSLGVAGFPGDGATSEDLMGAVDAALYAAKQGGRDRVVTASAAAPG